MIIELRNNVIAVSVPIDAADFIFMNNGNLAYLHNAIDGLADVSEIELPKYNYTILGEYMMNSIMYKNKSSYNEILLSIDYTPPYEYECEHLGSKNATLGEKILIAKHFKINRLFLEKGCKLTPQNKFIIIEKSQIKRHERNRN